MLDILNTIPGKKRQSVSGWWSFNAVCCHHRGHNPDRRGRAGVIFSDPVSWNYSCFNCGFKCGIVPGKHYGPNTRKLLDWCGLDRRDIDRHSFANFVSRETTQGEFKPAVARFERRELPAGAVPLDPQNPLHAVHVQYLTGRGLDPQLYPYWVYQTGSERERNSVIIPYFHNGEIVGYTCRFYDGRHPKYLSEQQRGYVFNIDKQHPDWQVCILVEGQFDAISIGGCAYLGATINDEQTKLISRLQRQVIVVPDQDSTGMTITERALECGYKVSIPPWDGKAKDVNDAVRLWGRLPTLISILENATSNKAVIELKRRKFK